RRQPEGAAAAVSNRALDPDRRVTEDRLAADHRTGHAAIVQELRRRPKRFRRHPEAAVAAAKGRWPVGGLLRAAANEGDQRTDYAMDRRGKWMVDHRPLQHHFLPVAAIRSGGHVGPRLTIHREDDEFRIDRIRNSLA